MNPVGPIEGRLRFCGSFVALGLLLNAASLVWSHPTAFLLFAFVGGPLILGGSLLYLYSVVSIGRQQPVASNETEGRDS